ASHRLFGILGLAEVEARSFVIGTHEIGAPAAAEPPCAASHAERLAASFRSLALMVGAMLWQARRLARSRRRADHSAGLPTPPLRPARPASAPSRSAPPDTS